MGTSLRESSTPAFNYYRLFSTRPRTVYFQWREDTIDLYTGPCHVSVLEQLRTSLWHIFLACLERQMLRKDGVMMFHRVCGQFKWPLSHTSQSASWMKKIEALAKFQRPRGFNHQHLSYSRFILTYTDRRSSMLINPVSLIHCKIDTLFSLSNSAQLINLAML